MKTELQELVDTGRLYLADAMPQSVYLYYDPSGSQNGPDEHWTHYTRSTPDGIWECTEAHGDLAGQIGGEDAETAALALLGVADGQPLSGAALRQWQTHQARVGGLATDQHG